LPACMLALVALPGSLLAGAGAARAHSVQNGLAMSGNMTALAAQSASSWGLASFLDVAGAVTRHTLLCICWQACALTADGTLHAQSCVHGAEPGTTAEDVVMGAGSHKAAALVVAVLGDTAPQRRGPCHAVHRACSRCLRATKAPRQSPTASTVLRSHSLSARQRASPPASPSGPTCCRTTAVLAARAAPPQARPPVPRQQSAAQARRGRRGALRPRPPGAPRRAAGGGRGRGAGRRGPGRRAQRGRRARGAQPGRSAVSAHVRACSALCCWRDTEPPLFGVLCACAAA